MNLPPLAPMPPPPPDFQYGGMPPPPPGAILVDDWHAAQPLPQTPFRPQTPMMEYFEESQEKSKKKDKKGTPVEVAYEGYMLEKAEPLPGERPSWQRVGKRSIPVDESRLVTLVKAHRKRTKTGPTTDFGLLTANQQGIVNRLVAEKNREEKNHNAHWILLDVERFGVWHWRSYDVKKIRVIVKRQDKTATKAKDKSNPDASSGYQYGEIIDLADPIPKKKDKKGGKHDKKDQFDEFDYIDDPEGLGIAPIDVGGPQGHEPGYFDQPYMPPAPPPMQQPQHQQPQQYPTIGAASHQPSQPYPSARAPFQGHPFEPYPGFMTPGLMEPAPNLPWPRQIDNQPHDDSNLEHRPSTKRSSSARRLKRVEGKLDDLNERINDWHISSDSSEGIYDDESIFTPAQSGGSFTPPSTPPLSPRNFNRRKPISRPHDDGGYYPRSRPKYYDSDRGELQAGYTYRSNRGRRVSEETRAPRAIEYKYRDHERRPNLHHANTYDDYPTQRVTEQRYITAPTPPLPWRPQRRFTDAGQRYDEYARADFDELRRQKREDRRNEMAYDATYAGGRRPSRRERYYG